MFGMSRKQLAAAWYHLYLTFSSSPLWGQRIWTDDETQTKTLPGNYWIRNSSYLFGCKFCHRVAPLEFVSKLATRCQVVPLALPRCLVLPNWLDVELVTSVKSSQDPSVSGWHRPISWIGPFLRFLDPSCLVGMYIMYLSTSYWSADGKVTRFWFRRCFVVKMVVFKTSSQWRGRTPKSYVMHTENVPSIVTFSSGRLPWSQQW